MQPYFKAAKEKWVVAGVINQIRLAKQRSAGIVVVEYKGCGRTHPKILNALKGYQRVVNAKKEQDDGTLAILNAIKRNFFSEDRIRVCGVNTSCCVMDTIEGLSLVFPNSEIQVVADSCNDEYSHLGAGAYLYLFTDNVRIL